MRCPAQPPISPTLPEVMQDDLVVACATIMHAVFQGNSEQTDHASAVAAMVAQMGGSPEGVAAAYLHDVAEDAVPEGEAPAGFLYGLGVPEKVAQMVLVLTRHINGEESYDEFIARILAYGGPEREQVILVKQADLLINHTRCIGKPDFEGLRCRYKKAMGKFAMLSATPNLASHAG